MQKIKFPIFPLLEDPAKTRHDQKNFNIVKKNIEKLIASGVETITVWTVIYLAPCKGNVKKPYDYSVWQYFYVCDFFTKEEADEYANKVMKIQKFINPSLTIFFFDDMEEIHYYHYDSFLKICPDGEKYIGLKYFHKDGYSIVDTNYKSYQLRVNQGTPVTFQRTIKLKNIKIDYFVEKNAAEYHILHLIQQKGENDE